jgi:hypothetical protein
MVAPNFKKATNTTDGGPTKYGAQDIKYAFDVLDGAHPTDRLQIQNIEGLSRITSTDWVIRQNDITNTTYEGIKTSSGIISYTSTTDFNTVLNSIIADSAFTDGDTILIKPSSTPYNCGATTAQAAITKSATIFGYGATIKPNTTRAASYTMKIDTAGKVLTVYGLTYDLNYPTLNYGGAIRGNVDGSGNGINIGGIRLYDVTIKNAYDYGINVGGSGTAGTLLPDCRIILDHCIFNESGAMSASAGSRGSLNQMLCTDSVEFVTISDCFFDSNKHFYISSRHVDIHNVLASNTDNAYDLTAISTIASQYIAVRSVRMNGHGLTIKPFTDVGADFRYGTCRNCVIDGLSVNNIAQEALNFEPYNDSTFRLENISVRNCNFGNIGIKLRTSNSDARHSSIDILRAQNCLLDILGGNATFIYTSNCDVLSLVVDNFLMNDTAGWGSNGNIVKVESADSNVTINNLDIRNVQPTEPANYVVWVADGGTGRTTTVNIRRSLDNGVVGVKTTNSTGTVNVKFRSNSGTGTITSGNTTATITHGLSFTPSAQDIILTPTNNLGAATQLYVSGTPGASSFVVTSDADPGAPTATFAWRARRN